MPGRRGRVTITEQGARCAAKLEEIPERRRGVWANRTVALLVVSSISRFESEPELSRDLAGAAGRDGEPASRWSAGD